jgi:hypothetical protein
MRTGDYNSSLGSLKSLSTAASIAVPPHSKRSDRIREMASAWTAGAGGFLRLPGALPGRAILREVLVEILI